VIGYDGRGAACVLVPVLTYLTDGTTLPPAGTTCTQHFDPFAG
jgi:hypothetical protein